MLNICSIHFEKKSTLLDFEYFAKVTLKEKLIQEETHELLLKEFEVLCYMKKVPYIVGPTHCKVT